MGITVAIQQPAVAPPPRVLTHVIHVLALVHLRGGLGMHPDSLCPTLLDHRYLRYLDPRYCHWRSVRHSQHKPHDARSRSQPRVPALWRTPHFGRRPHCTRRRRRRSTSRSVHRRCNGEIIHGHVTKHIFTRASFPSSSFQSAAYPHVSMPSLPSS